MATAPWEQRDRYIYARRVTEPRLTAEYADISAAPQQLLHVVTATLAQPAVIAPPFDVHDGSSLICPCVAFV